MIFTSVNFRILAPDALGSLKIRKMDDSPLILVKGTGSASYGRTRAEKDTLITAFEPEADLLLFAWKGQYHTDIFRLSATDIENYYK